MLRNCSSALEESTAAAETGRSVVSGLALSCVWGGVTTAWVVTLTLLPRVAAPATTGLPDWNEPEDRDELDLANTQRAEATEEAHAATIVH